MNVGKGSSKLVTRVEKNTGVLIPKPQETTYLPPFTSQERAVNLGVLAYLPATFQTDEAQFTSNN